MAKQKNDATVVDTPAGMEEFNEELMKEDEGRDFEIIQAANKDGKCHYRWRVTKGRSEGEENGTKGLGLIMDSLEHSLGRLRVHMAVIDGVFKQANIDVEDIDTFHTHELAGMFHVDEIKIGGSEDNETVVIVGSKYTPYGRIGITTPKMALDSLSSYPFHNELDAAVKVIREEVSLYREGNFTLPEEDDEMPESHKAKGKKIKQRTIADELKDRENEEGADEEQAESDALEPNPEIGGDFDESSKI